MDFIVCLMHFHDFVFNLSCFLLCVCACVRAHVCAYCTVMFEPLLMCALCVSFC